MAIVDMFAIFSLRRPDILPVGDLGVQRGLARWALARHSPAHPFSLAPEKLPKGDDENEKSDADAAAAEETTPIAKAEVAQVRASSPDASSVPPAPAPATPGRGTKSSGAMSTPAALGLPTMPTPFTASIERTLAGATAADDTLPTVNGKLPPLPQGLSVSVLKSRLDGKKVKYVYSFFHASLPGQRADIRLTMILQGCATDTARDGGSHERVETVCTFFFSCADCRSYPDE
jgi:DNA-3-methyladenine glycosylase II